MDLSSWFRRSLLSTEKKTKNPDLQKHFPNQDQPSEQQKEEEELLGLTDKFIDFLKTFTLETFKKFPLPAAEEGTHGDDLPTTSGSVRKDLTEWQERHAKAVLLRVKEISQLRYKLCPGYLKEHQFWRIYFSLVKSHVTEYELHAIRLAKLKEMASGHGKSTDTDACEVEMAETNRPANLLPPTS
ncbi:uncharacterized protein LOC107426597 isoform X1 [Ziziphus jujuba]|uniref:Uncharacterized protein LOC107426597 isoform X1 n=1 Tax=Ziziphus jujuba TaxID=326968 RepID=A0A6P4A8N3_ZIZJJ|nr:uncharacterized protein LOC107426597 isoform X1 [Ziziphus jujuba]